jgi:hypothetical protein
VALDDRLIVVISKLNAETAMGLVALKNNKIAVPKRAVKEPADKPAETNSPSEVKS